MHARSSGPLLVRGDTVGVVAPGFAVQRARLESGVRRLRGMGFRVKLGSHVLSRHGYFAGDDDARARDLREMLLDPEVRAVWFARGGYGTARILDRVPWRKLARHPKLLIGYSDLTSLRCAAVQRTDRVCLHGPVVAELGRPEAYHAPSLKKLLAGQPLSVPVRKRQVLAEGRARGRLIGGNLTVLAHLQGTRYAPDLRGAVLFLEEVGEQVYRIDRALTHLEMAGALRGVAGVLLGRFSAAARRSFPPDRDPRLVLAEFFTTRGIPVIDGLPAGHVSGQWSLPLGGMAELDTFARRLQLAP